MKRLALLILVSLDALDGLETSVPKVDLLAGSAIWFGDLKRCGTSFDFHKFLKTKKPQCRGGG